MHFTELKRLYDLPFFELLKLARAVHEENWPEPEVQLCTLLSIKTGGCSEDCGYCAQSSRYRTGLQRESLMTKETVMERARAARDNGSTRFCMGAAWKGVRMGTQKFEQVIDIVRGVSTLGMEVCATLGELGVEEAAALKDAGVTAYNHNVDTSREHYPNIVTTHTYDDRLSKEAQAMCYFAGTNSIFYGDKILTTANPRANEDLALLRELGLSPQRPNPQMLPPSADPDRAQARAMGCDFVQPLDGKTDECKFRPVPA